jgi:hypothetical protein
MKKGKLIRNIILAIVMLGFITYHFFDLINIAKEKHEWTEERKGKVIDKMKTDFLANSPEYLEYQDVVLEYCICAVNKYSSNYNFSVFADSISELPEDEKSKLLVPLTQECTDALIAKLKPHKANIKFKREVNACRKRAIESGNFSSKEANEYCVCILSYLYDKYGDLENLNVDSIKIVESEQINKCLTNVETLKETE